MDLNRAREAVPESHTGVRDLRLISQALGADIQFIARHPTTLFQCLWNRCWWYDCPESAARYQPPPGGWSDVGPPWCLPEPARLSTLLQAWREAKEARSPRFPWLQSLRPPPFPLGGAELARLVGHERVVFHAAFDRDGRRIVTASYDNTARVWDAQTGAALARLVGHENWVYHAAFDRDGRRIVTASYDNTARVWDAQTGKCLEVIVGARDVAAIASGAKAYLWRALRRGLETVIEPAVGGEPIASFPVAQRNLVAHPSGRIWAGSVGNHLYIIRLEGEPKSG
jgi:hypothetical protein